MKINLILFSLILSHSIFFSQDFLFHVEPLNWWVDMKSPRFQILVHGNNVGECDVTISDKKVKLIKINKLENSNYLALDLEIIEREEAFNFDIEFSNESKLYEKYNYQMKKRSKRSMNNETFNSSDVIYLITPDRFSNGDKSNDKLSYLREKKINRRKPSSRHGGDIQGIINHLDYIEEMGFTAIWPTPMLENNMKELSYHGYAITDHYKIDPRMGTNELYQQLSIKAKNKGIKLLKDVVLNHIGSNHWWMTDMPSEDWINNANSYKNTTHNRESLHDPYAVNIDRKEFTDGWFVKTMPDLNQRNPILSRYLIQNSLWWIEYGQLSGFRVDTYSYSDRKFLNKWNNTIQKEYPGFNIVGEEWTVDKSILGLWQKPNETKKKENNSVINQKYPSNIPSLMDFPLNDAIIKSFQPKEKKWDHRLSILYKNLAQVYLYPNPQNMVIFLDNHDMSRTYCQLKHDIKYWKMAQAFLLTTRGIPQVYYGTEVLLSDSVKPGDHGVLREDFPGGWDHDKKNAFSGNISDKQLDAQLFMKNILNWRKSCSAVHRGEFRHFSPNFENEIYSIIRYDKKSTVLLIMNNDAIKKKITPSYYINQIDKKSNKKLAIDIVSKKEINIKSPITINSKSFLLIELRN